MNLGKQDIYIRIKAFDQSLLEMWVRKFIDEMRRCGAKLSGPIVLPTKRSVFVVNKSPHVDKKSREQFEIRSSKRLVVLRDLTSSMMQMLTGFSFPAGVEVDLKVKSR